MKTFYITTPIYYVNDVPHVGHAYTTIAADAVARYYRLRGFDVRFLTGTDENSQKNVEAAAKHGYDDVQTYLDVMGKAWKSTWEKLGITFDDFIRTTEPRHKIGVEKFWRLVEKSGDISLGEYEGLYCTGCETFYTESNLVDGKCPVHKTEPSRIKEKNFFFKLSAYREKLLAHIDAHPDFVQPVSRRNEVRSYVDRFMEDVSISRESVKWGIPVPGAAGHVIYVWFDALINYLTGIGYGTDDAEFERFWPANLHLVGKDIIKFHCALWPAMLMSAGLPLPERIFANGYFTLDGEKISKSLGNTVSPLDVANEFGIDTLRFFLLREITFGEDGDFSFDRLRQRYNGDLGNDLGNLLHRVLSMTEKYFDGKVPTPADGDMANAWADGERGLEALDFSLAIDAVWTVLRDSNRMIDAEKPWELAKTDRVRLAEVIYVLLERLRHAAWLLKPLMPRKADEILEQLGIAEAEGSKTWEQAKVWGGFPEGATVKKGTPLFPRLEEKKDAA